jgi:hypothetical protein
MASNAQNVFNQIAADFDTPSDKRVEQMLKLALREGRIDEYAAFRKSLAHDVEAWINSAKQLPRPLEASLEKISSLAADPSAPSFALIDQEFQTMVNDFDANRNAYRMMKRQQSDMTETMIVVSRVEKELDPNNRPSIGFSRAASPSIYGQQDRYSFPNSRAALEQLSDNDAKIRQLGDDVTRDQKMLKSVSNAIDGIRQEFEAAEAGRSRAEAERVALQKSTMREYFTHLQTVGLKTEKPLTAPRTAKFTAKAF